VTKISLLENNVWNTVPLPSYGHGSISMIRNIHTMKPMHGLTILPSTYISKINELPTLARGQASKGFHSIIE